ncbi:MULTISPECIES: type I restriction endonuclease subunit R [unclassified Myroides]|uniref:type I restriction endonuclease subunit R n=1 Tax=unclassified Myroides TaxID=2642485 RepID=UPI0031017C69
MTENDIELLAIELLQKQAYTYINGADIAPDSATPARTTFEEVVLKEHLEKAVRRINSSIPIDAQNEAIKEVMRIASPDLLANNESFHRLLSEGISITKRVAGQERGDLVNLIDFENPLHNEFLVINQFTIVENGVNKRPDIIIFVNGLPLVVIELKNATNEQTTINAAFRQIETYKAMIPSLFTFNAFSIISDGLEAKAGTVSAGISRFMTWKTSDGKQEASHLVSQLETLITGMLQPATLLDLMRHFIVFEKFKKEDENGIVSVRTVKKLAGYHQYYAVNRAVESTLRASGFISKQKLSHLLNETPESYGLPGVKQQEQGDRRGGVVWHTQGSGKSLSMVFYTGKIVLALDNPTILVITDRNDLDDQLFDTFAASKQLLRQDPVQATDRKRLKELLKVNSGGVIFTTIQKFQPEEGNVFETLSERENIIVIADEAHRTQYGFKPKTIDDKDDQGNVIGKRIVYGFAKYMRDALPNATYLGFTGTPIESLDVNTPAVFGNYVDVYDIAQAVEDGATVRIFYESRLVKIKLTEEGKELVEEVEDDLENEDETTTQKAKSKWTQLEAIIGGEDRIKNIATDIVSHFTQRQEVFEGKGMIVSMSRRIAADLYNAIVALKPEWHSDDLKKGKIKVIMTSASSDGPTLAKFHTTKEQRRMLAERMKDPNDELELVIVRDMWLTGFDAPSMHTLYIDKPMKGHNLMQAIARVNRVFKDKPGGLIVDYLGIASDLKKALAFYSDAGGKGDPAIAQEQAVSLMLEKIEIISNMYYGFAYEDYFDATTSDKLSLILAAEDHILGLDNGKKRYIDEVTALSQAFAIAIPHEQAMDVKEEVSFFQAVKARLAKFDSSSTGRTNEDLETTIRQVIDQALVSDQVIDVFDAAGIKKPDISILSEEFLMELKDMQHKNIALEVLKKLLNDEIRTRSKTNLVQSKTLMEMLEQSINRYHNKILTAAEVIDELINLSKDIVEMDSEPKKLGLTEYEYAFYTAVANNDSAKELIQQDKLRELAVALTATIKMNASIDWNIKDSVRAKLKVAVKRLLRKYGYPPDMQLLATETVLKQAEMLAKELMH